MGPKRWEWIFWGAGLALLGWVALVQADRWRTEALALRAVGGSPPIDPPAGTALAHDWTLPADHGDWSPGRIEAWATPDPRRILGVLEIESLDVTAPLLDGTDATTLDRGVGRIEGTGAPGSGNLGIAGHRDSYFRRLGRLEPGDEIRVRTRTDQYRYEVEDAWVVDPEDVHVLEETPEATLTLVSCFPFYYVGPAPQRFVVRARLQETGSGV